MTTGYTREIDVDVYLDTTAPPTTATMLSGGIRVTVGDEVLTRFEEPERVAATEWAPEYVGLHVRSDVVNLLHVAGVFGAGEVGRYETRIADVEATPAYLLAERLSGSSLRLAFRSREESVEVPPAVACGLAVETGAFCSAVASTGREFLEAARDYLGDDQGALDGLERTVAAVEAGHDGP